MDYVTLNNGLKMPQIGLGCWKIDKSTCSEQIYEAIKIGYRLFDGAMDYGNEKEIGEGIQRALKEEIVKREELYIVSKLWNNYHSPKAVELAIEKVLKDLQLNYLDLFYIHFPIAFKFVPIDERYPPTFYCGDNNKFIYENVPLLTTYKSFERLVKISKIKSIGLSNFSGALIQDLLRGCEIKPQVVQIEHHPFLQQPRLVEWLNFQNIAITGYSTFGPQSFFELDHPKAKKIGSLFENPIILKISKNHHNINPAKIILRWVTQRGICIIPKSNKKKRLEENLKINDFDLTTEEIEEINKLDLGLRFNDPWTWDKLPTFL